MEFITNYWVILLVAFILLLLVLLSYLIDKEIRNMRDNDEEPEIEESNDKEVYVNKIEESNKSSVVEETTVNDDVTNDDEEIVDKSKELDYDELDIDDIDDDFNKVIHRKKIIDDTLIDSVEAMHIDDIDIDDNTIDTNIELPEIKIKKDMNEDIWWVLILAFWYFNYLIHIIITCHNVFMSLSAFFTSI